MPTWEASAPDSGADEGWEQVGLFDEEGAAAEPGEAGDGLADVLEAEPGENGFEDYEGFEYEAEEGYGLAGAMELAEEADEELEEDEPEEEAAAEEAEYLIAPPEPETVETARSEREEFEQEAPEVEPRSEENLLYEAGRLFLDENRVAVSMLQRRFELDFERACELLDRLQEEGLIGPYVGGRTREILLTREEWDAKAASLA